MTFALSLVSVTVVAAVTAALRVTVQADVPEPVTVFGEQATPLIADGGGRTVNATDALPAPAALAVTVAVTVCVGVPAEAVNATDEDPAGTVIVAGTVRAALFELSATASPPAGAADDSCTVQFDCAPAAIVVGVQLVPVIDGGARTFRVPPVPVMDTDFASGVAPNALSTAIAAVLDGTNVMVATTPSGIVVVFKPNAMQV